jgi:hypothetical protein
MSIKCADCECIPELCIKQYLSDCKFCIKNDCCCLEIHQKKSNSLVRFFSNVRAMYASALGIEILCILSAEIGQNSSFFLLGFKTPFAITISYILGYGLAGFTTFATILGRYNVEKVADGCCSVLENEDSKGFLFNLKATFNNFVVGIRKIPQLYKSSDFRKIMKTSLYVLITGESICILTAETVNLVFFRQALWLSIPLSLLAGAFAITVLEAYRKTKTTVN